ncbi:hypothetical protein XENORESO_014486 [Xenotaenia resolanae]|uniref:Uncharacterized protein n=1 Tax=Xenotaenia resolanae TaxID=208358 RepID=A0ABV0X4D1_9TELE
MSSDGIHFFELTISQMSRKQLATILLKYKTRAEQGDELRSQLWQMKTAFCKMERQLQHVEAENDKLARQLIQVNSEKKALERLEIPGLHQEIKNQCLNNDALSLKIKDYRNQVEKLQLSITELKRESNKKLHKLDLENQRLQSEILESNEKAKLYQNHTNKLKLEISKKNNELAMKNSEILKEKDESDFLENKVKQVENQFNELKKKQTPFKPNTVEQRLFDRTREMCKARYDLTFGLLTQEIQQRKELQKSLFKKDKQLKEHLQQQENVKGHKQLRKSFDQANNDRIITSLKRRNKILTAKVGALTAEMQRQNKLAEHVKHLKTLYYSEKMKFEDLKEHLKKNDIVLDSFVIGEQESYSETHTTKPKGTFLPPIVGKSLLKPETRPNRIQEIVFQGEVKSQPVCNAEPLTQQKLALFKPAPPATRKPQIPSRRIFCLTETDKPVAKKQLGRENTTGKNDIASPNVQITGTRISYVVK